MTTVLIEISDEQDPLKPVINVAVNGKPENESVSVPELLANVAVEAMQTVFAGAEDDVQAAKEDSVSIIMPKEKKVVATI